MLWHVNQIGAALDRAGCFEEAVTRLTESTEPSCHPCPTNLLTTWFYLAVATEGLSELELHDAA